MTLWTITNDMVPWQHEGYAKYHTYRPWGEVMQLEITPEWVYGAHVSDEIIYDSNNYAVREELAAYSDGMGGSCADHISTSRGMLSVPLWRDDDAGPSGGYHPAAIVGMSILARLEDYPLLDESDFCERETAAWGEYLVDAFRWADIGEREDAEIDSHRARFIEYCWENFVGYYSVWDVPAEEIDRAYAATKEETTNA